MATRPGKNPFNDDDDVDDLTFIKSRPSNYVLAGKNQNGSDQEYFAKRQQLMEERKRIEERTLQSAKASVSLVYESEKVGLATAEELVRQGEKLQTIDSNLDSMNSVMRQTQKHLTSMKSIFGGVKNYFSKSPNDAPPSSLPSSKSTGGLVASNPSRYQSKLGPTIESISNDTSKSQNHPMFPRKGMSFDDDTIDHKPVESTKKSFNQQLDSNLDELGAGLGRLKSLALGLGNEIEEQNEMLEKIMTKTDRADDTITYQNRQMKQILKK